MRLYQQLVLFMLAATVLPLALVGFWLLRGAERELAHRIGSEQRARAEAAAQRASRSLLDAVELIARTAENFDLESATQKEIDGALKLLYQQSPAVSAVMLVDAKGAVISEPVFGLDGHPGFRREGV